MNVYGKPSLEKALQNRAIADKCALIDKYNFDNLSCMEYCEANWLIANLYYQSKRVELYKQRKDSLLMPDSSKAHLFANVEKTISQSLQSEETVMNSINLLLAKNEQFKFVTAVFNLDMPFESQKQYTYKTLLDVQAGDVVVAQANAGIELVKIVSVGVKATGNFEYKWIVAKVNLAHLEEVKTIEAELKALISAEHEKREEAEKTKVLEEFLGVEGVSKAEAIAKKVRI